MYNHGMYRNKFEQSLEALSSYETNEAQSLMTEALEAMDMMNNAIVLQNEVRRRIVLACHVALNSSFPSMMSVPPRLKADQFAIATFSTCVHSSCCALYIVYTGLGPVF